jgi:hypothetical protein
MSGAISDRSPAKAGVQAHAPNWTPAFAGERKWSKGAAE